MVRLPKKLVLDTSVVLEYIVARSPYRGVVKELFSRASTASLSST